MTQIEMINAQKTVEDTDAMVSSICDFRINGGCGEGIKERCFHMVMCGRCNRCRITIVSEEHKNELLRSGR